MKKPVRLNDIPREDVFKVPDNYFEALPDRIQKRVSAQQKRAWYAQPLVQGTFKYALPAVTLLLLGYVFLLSPAPQEEALFASLDEATEHEMLAFLVDNGASTQELSAVLELNEGLFFSDAEPLPADEQLFEQLENDALLDDLLDDIDLSDISDI